MGLRSQIEKSKFLISDKMIPGIKIFVERKLHTDKSFSINLTCLCVLRALGSLVKNAGLGFLRRWAHILAFLLNRICLNSCTSVSSFLNTKL